MTLDAKQIPKKFALVLRVYDDRVVLEKGILSKDVKECFIRDIRIIDVKRIPLQRIFKIGSVMIGTAGTAGYEHIAYGLPDPRGIKDLIMSQKQKHRGTED